MAPWGDSVVGPAMGTVMVIRKTTSILRNSQSDKKDRYNKRIILFKWKIRTIIQCIEKCVVI